MFSRKPKETEQDALITPPEDLATPAPPSGQEGIFSFQTSVEDISETQQDIDMTQPQDRPVPEFVKNAEKISGIVSPYFTVVVGLILYENNFLLGLVLIVVGMLGVLRISWGDIVKFFEWVKNLLGFNEEEIN